MQEVIEWPVMREQNGVWNVHCHNCEKAYPPMDVEKTPLEVPRNCRRCGCPMNSLEDSLAYGDMMAEAEAKPLLRAVGDRMRSLTGVSQKMSDK